MAHLLYLLFTLTPSSMLYTFSPALVMLIFHEPSLVTTPLMHLQHIMSTNLSTTMHLTLLYNSPPPGTFLTLRCFFLFISSLSDSSLINFTPSIIIFYNTSCYSASHSFLTVLSLASEACTNLYSPIPFTNHNFWPTDPLSWQTLPYHQFIEDALPYCVEKQATWDHMPS